MIEKISLHLLINGLTALYDFLKDQVGSFSSAYHQIDDNGRITNDNSCVDAEFLELKQALVES